MKAALGFLALAAAAGALIGVTRALTHESIAANKAAAEAAIIAELLGGAIDPDAAARLCRAEVRGYAGTISFLVLPRKQDTPERVLEAVRVVSHRETPGIGDFIELRNSNWMRSFDGLANQSETAATVALWDRQLDAVTGATITRRAMIEGIANACPAASPSDSRFAPANGSDPLFGTRSAQPLGERNGERKGEHP